MNDLIFHPTTRQALGRALTGRAHALLIVGELGSGKRTTALYLASELLGQAAQQSPYYLHIQPDGKSIGIESIRKLQKFLQLKTTGSQAIRRVVIVEDADGMTVESQNALLKVLEEPPADTVIILTASQPQNLRPTIHSRVQKLTILPPTKGELSTYFKKRGKSDTEIDRAYMVSNGQVGLMSALLESDETHVLAERIAEAKQLYGLSTFERLAKVDEIAKRKDELAQLLFACKRICMAALEQAAARQQDAAVKTWHKQLKLVVKAENALPRNPNTKLLLTDLFIQM